jgi:hypothetical protein
MVNEIKKRELSSQSEDYITLAVKGMLGAIPFAGSLLAELAGTIIPNQRVDRIVKFAEVLETRLSDLEHEFVNSQLRNDSFTDLLEEGVRQAARAYTNERTEYIANLISNSLSPDQIEYTESKQLLTILSELNDAEIIWLRFYLEPTIGGDYEFRTKHKAILDSISATFSSPQITHDKHALQKSYK